MIRLRLPLRSLRSATALSLVVGGIFLLVACGGNAALSDNPTKGQEMSYVIGYHMTKSGADADTAWQEVQQELEQEGDATPDRAYFDAGCRDAKDGKDPVYKWNVVD